MKAPDEPVAPKIARALEWVAIGIQANSGENTATTQFKVALGFTEEAREELDRCLLVTAGAREVWSRMGIEKNLRDAINDLLTVINSPGNIGAAISAQIELERAQRSLIGVDLIPLPPVSTGGR